MEHESEQEQWRRRADHFIHVMSPPSTSTEGQNRHNVSMNPNLADIFQYNTSTPIDQLQPMRDVVRPNLRLRPAIKFPRLPVQTTSQKDFQL